MILRLILVEVQVMSGRANRVAILRHLALLARTSRFATAQSGCLREGLMRQRFVAEFRQ